jgi:tripartite-type tricarboxylate transporter receptor subunit TctC
MARIRWVTGLSNLLLVATTSGYVGAAETPFFQGKTVTAIVAQTPDGTGGLRARTVLQHLPKYITGNPAIVIQYMGGGGGNMAANHLAHVVKRDGLTIANLLSSVFSNAIFSAEGVRYKLDDFVPLGSPVSGGPYTLVVRPGLKLDTVEKLRVPAGLRFAQRSVGHTMYLLDRMFAYVLEIKEPKWILGYGSNEVYLSLVRSEADMISNNLHTVLRETREWLKEGFTTPVVMKNTKGRGAEAVPEFPQGRPTLEQFADTDLKRAVMRFQNATRPTGAPYFAPKGIPGPALKALREGFNKMFTDPQFAKEYERLTGEPPDPMAGEEIDEVLRQMPKDPRVAEIYKQLIGAGPLPPSR